MNIYFKVFIVLFGLAYGQVVAAETVHTWIDAQGLRHYSQFPPPDSSQTVDTLELEMQEQNEPTLPLEQRIRTVLDVARELELSRQEREQQHDDQEAANAPAPPASSVYDPEPDRIFLPYPYAMPYSPYPYPPKQHPHWKNKHPVPGEPDEREPRLPESRIFMPPSQDSVPEP